MPYGYALSWKSHLMLPCTFCVITFMQWAGHSDCHVICHGWRHTACQVFISQSSNHKSRLAYRLWPLRMRSKRFSDVTWAPWHLKSTVCSIVFRPTARPPPTLRITGPLWGESIGDRWVPFTKVLCNAESLLPILWLQHVLGSVVRCNFKSHHG